METKLKLKKADITKEEVDVIVNAANSSLLRGGGVDGAIHQAAGPELAEECLKLGGCEKGEAKITKGYNLPAKFIIHTVGPMYGLEDGREEEILRACYKNSLELAREKKLQSIAFPCVSTGAYRFPNQRAAGIAVNAVKEYIEENSHHFSEIRFVVFTDEDYRIYQKLLGEKTK